MFARRTLTRGPGVQKQGGPCPAHWLSTAKRLQVRINVILVTWQYTFLSIFVTTICFGKRRHSQKVIFQPYYQTVRDMANVKTHAP